MERYGPAELTFQCCPTCNVCRSSTKDLPLAQRQRITIKSSLSPCRNYSVGEYWYWQKGWTALDFPHLRKQQQPQKQQYQAQQQSQPIIVKTKTITLSSSTKGNVQKFISLLQELCTVLVSDSSLCEESPFDFSQQRRPFTKVTLIHFITALMKIHISSYLSYVFIFCLAKNNLFRLLPSHNKELRCQISAPG